MSFKPSHEEQKWAKLQELDIKKKLQDFIKRQKSLEFPDIGATCPTDGNVLEKIQIDDTGVFVHKCTHCGGIWISRSDMERLINSVEKSNKLVKYLAKLFNIHL